MGSLKFHEHCNNIAHDEHLHSDTSSEDEHSFMDYEITAVLTDMEHIVTSPPTPQPRPSKTHPTPPPWSSKVKNKITSCREATAEQCIKSVLTHPYPQTRKTPLLPTLTMPAWQHTKWILISGPPQCSSNRYQHNSYISRPQNAPIHHRQWPPLLPSPPQRPNITHGHFHPQVPISLPVLVITLTDHFMNLLANQAAHQMQLAQQTWSTHAF